MTVNTHKISVYIDLAFCLVVLPMILSIIPIEKMFANSTIFTVVLIAFLYAVYFLYRKVRVPSLLPPFPAPMPIAPSLPLAVTVPP